MHIRPQARTMPPMKDDVSNLRTYITIGAGVGSCVPLGSFVLLAVTAWTVVHWPDGHRLVAVTGLVVGTWAVTCVVVGTVVASICLVVLEGAVVLPAEPP